MRRIAYLAAVSVMLASMSVAGAPTKSGAETGLLGIHLYDSGLKIVSIFGTPNEIQAVNLGGSGNTTGGGPPGIGGGGAGGVPGGPAGMMPGRKGGGGAGASSAAYTGFGFGDTLLQGFVPPPQSGGGPGGGMPPGVPPQGQGVGRKGGPMGGPGGGPPGGVGFPGAGAGQGMATDSGKVIFTRWVYNRAGSKYGFVLDKFSRVIQIEAIGISNPRVHTARGIAFGSSFAQIIKKYNRNPDGSANAPDGYEISGDTLVVRYLVKNKVAFRLSRLGRDKPQVVTGIAVAAGKL
ncbi:MAG: hypothetical protein ACYC96_03215 [Fimbriimonadaceae bacterium]